MAPIRVLQVLTIMNRGGAETMIMNYYRNMDRTKIQFDFLLHRPDVGVFDEEIKNLGGNIYRLSNINFANLQAYQKSLDAFFKNHTEYKIVHAHLNALSVFVLKAAKNNGIPVRIAHSHTSLYHININPFSKKRSSMNFIVKFLAQNYFKFGARKYANHFLACGKQAGIWLFGENNLSKVTFINNAIASSNFTYNQSIANDYKKKLNVKNKLVIGHVGNFVPEKNHTFLLKVFKEIKKLNMEAVLILVGGGNKTPMEVQAKNMKLNNSVQFLGVRDDVAQILQAMDVFIFPSTNEGLPVTLIEAQAAGLKIIASNGVSNELNITGLVNFESLKQKPKRWAELTIALKNYNRTNTKNLIVSGNYDIGNNAIMLQDFYKKNITLCAE